MASEELESRIDLGPDQQEIQRLTLNHELFRVAYGQLIQAPIDMSKPGLRILDSGCADGKLNSKCFKNNQLTRMQGLWLRDIQYSAPASHAYVGTDINGNLFPSEAPASVKFQVQDITNPWPTEWENSFDLVHQRLVLAGCYAFPVKQAVKSLVDLVKPGGWIQLEEMPLDKQEKIPGTSGEVGRLIKEMFIGAGCDWNFAASLEQYLSDAGVEDIEGRIFEVPFGKTSPDPEFAKKGVIAHKLSATAVTFGAKSTHL